MSHLCQVLRTKKNQETFLRLIALSLYCKGKEELNGISLASMPKNRWLANISSVGTILGQKAARFSHYASTVSKS